MKKIIILLLTLVMMTTFMASSCKGSENNNEEANQNQRSALYIEPESFDETDIVLIKNKSSEYVIVIPDNPTQMESYAAEELQYFIKESTGCTLSVISDAGISHDNNAKYLSIGETSLLKAQTDIVIDIEVMGESGPTVIRKDNTVYMCGASAYGTLNSVYKFLEYQIGFMAYAVDYVYYDYFNELKLLDFSYQYVPTVAKMTAHEVFGEEYVKDVARMYMLCGTKQHQSTTELFEGYYWDGYFCHTNQFFLSPTEYPHLYKNNQICYTSEEALQVFSQNVFNLLYANESINKINLGVNDYPTSCDCETCLEQTAIYNGGGVLIRFCNAVAENIDNWFKERGITRKVELVPLLYYNYITPPVRLDPNGNYVPIDDTVYPRKGDISVGFMYTPILSCYQHSYQDPCETNKQNRSDLLGWSVFKDVFYMYSYGANFPGKHTYFNNMSYMADQFKWYYDNEIRFEMVHEQGYGADLGVLDDLKMFVRSRLGWNPLLKLEDVVADFVTHYYGVAGEWVDKYYHATTDHFEWIYNEKGTDCLYPLTTSTSDDFWPKNTLLSFENYILNGMREIELSSYTNLDKEIYKERLNRELFLIRYNEYLYYETEFTKDEQEVLRNYVNENIVKPGYNPTGRS